MPQLKSGRHVAVGDPGLIEAVSQDDENRAINAAMISISCIRERRDLIEALPVVYFDEREGTPPDCPNYPSGLLVRDVFEGKSDWRDDEVSEFRSWVDNNPGLHQWIDDYFKQLIETISTSRILENDDL